MKVCQLCAVDFTLQKFLLPLVDAMQEKGWQVTSVCSNGKSISVLREKGYKITTIPISRSLNIFKHIVALFRLTILFRQEKFDVVHVHTPIAALIGRVAAKINGVPLIIYTAHGFYFHDDMPNWKKRFFIILEKIAGSFTDVLFTQSAEDAATAIEEKIISRKKVFAIGNGVSTKHFNPDHIENKEAIKSSLGIVEDAIVIGMIARLVKEKGVLEFFEAAVQLSKLYENVCFVLIGDRLESDHAEDINRAVSLATETMGKKLILTGLRSDIPQLLSIMDVYCLPSWREGMPRSIIEAMMMGKPVIATDIRGSREEVIDNVTGILVPVRNPIELKNAMKRCIEDPGWSKKLGRKGRMRALELYDEDKIVSWQVTKIEEQAKIIGL